MAKCSYPCGPNDVSHTCLKKPFPSTHWRVGSIGRLEASIQSFRAVEQGFSLFRCGSWAPSTAWDAYHQLFGYTYNLGFGSFHADIPLRKHVSTIYTAVGNLWSYICCVYALVSLILVLTPPRFLNQGMARFGGQRLFLRVGSNDTSVNGSNASGDNNHLASVDQDSLAHSRAAEQSV